MILAERQPQPRRPVEHHDGDAVLIAQCPESLMRRRSDALDMGPHAGADVQQQHNVDGDLFACEIADGPRLALLAQNEILRAKTGDGAVVAVDHLGVYPHQRDIAAENGFVLRGRRRVPNNAGQEQQQTDNTYPRHRSIELAIR